VHPLVTNLKEALQRLRIKPKVQGSEGATVITFFQHKNIPAVATGFGSAGCAHSANEYIKLSNLYKGAAVLEEFLKSFKFSGIK
jgi:acetylornithine deacetylase/succinyl-diaminopimelate desuccinylase-like protein